MEEQKFEVIGGSLEKSLNGETRLDLKALAKEAWDLTKDRKYEVMQGVIFIFFIGILLSIVIQSFFGVTDIQTASPEVSMMVKIIGIVITAPIIATMLLLGISHSVGSKPPFLVLFKKILGSVLVILLTLAIAVLTDLSSALASSVSVLIGYIVLVYLGMATGFSMMLLVEKNLAPSQTIIQSFKVYNRFILPLSFFYFASVVLFVLGVFTLGIAYIWLIPFYINLKGILYRELFGVKVAKVDNNTQNNGSVFHA
ncbi:hypothetical protein RS130_15305 [Paraglaciecola aquimarina]|uniref:DUF975 family protein n=1 Tax=Paraglaciecola aquimarina TaxID=1235557 RepID=A0ABU3SYJ6_9ALTE|nr:hypothetical protein [Paraglaciecola aquimarina]MDU0355084.1 hypothetical protein [Paraglaciecola aquimarina]